MTERLSRAWTLEGDELVGRKERVQLDDITAVDFYRGRFSTDWVLRGYGIHVSIPVGLRRGPVDDFVRRRFLDASGEHVVIMGLDAHQRLGLPLDERQREWLVFRRVVAATLLVALVSVAVIGALAGR